MLSKASINGIRHLMNSRLLPDTTVFEVNRHLELAYYLERNREYRQALREYSVFSETGPVLGIIWLHQGYCHAILGEVSQARNLFLQVIQEHGDSQLGVTASILLAYLERFVHEGGRVASGGMKRQERAVNLAELFQCKEALMVIDSLDAKESLKASTAYYKGLCLEELGDKLGATKSYAKSIKGSEDLTLSRDANRRLLIIGSQISPSNSIRNSAIRMNQTFQDPIFKEIQKADLPSRVLPVSDSIPAQVAPEMDSLEEFVKENASTQATSKTRPERVKLMTKSGKVLYGELLSGKQDRIQRIRTIMGVVGIPQKEIANIIAQ
jgi:tetratricopeptide (TPR) repeat protein